jgi:hypothetical protein
MADPVTNNKALYTPAHAADPGTWDVPVNANWNNIDQAFGTYTGLNVNGQSGDVALTVSQSIPLGFIISGTLTANVNYQTPAAAGGFWYVRNPLAANSFNVTFSSLSGGNSVLIPPQENVIISSDGTANGMVNAVTVLQAAAGANTQVQVNNNGLLAGYAGFTYNNAAQLLTVPGFNNTGSTILGDASGDVLIINGTAITVPNGFNFNAGQFQMNPAGDIGIGTAPVGGALLTVAGTVAIPSGGVSWPNGTVQTTAEVLQIVATAVTATPSLNGTYATSTGAAPTTGGGSAITAMATTFTPISAGSTLEIEIVVKGASISGTDNYILALFNGSTLVDLVTDGPVFNGGGQATAIILKTWLASPGTSAQSFTVRLGSNSGSTFVLNSTNTGGGAVGQAGSISWMSIKEIQAG